jgi:hypothetical protein
VIGFISLFTPSGIYALFLAVPLLILLLSNILAESVNGAVFKQGISRKTFRLPSVREKPEE